ncbi:MAG: hypothetical protein IV094_06615 [Vitreoscilla sp.]|nr:hypothetical protein [Vitreoscilla sp.]
MRVFLKHYAGIDHQSPTDGWPATELQSVVTPVVQAAKAPALAAIEREQWALDDIVCDEEAIERHRC